ncbi:hypothetical protein ABIB94_007336 [Bradyrhizobium sp. JR7.2]|uniref:hypothetical protein n=1 Tax=Bradyrhizobium TaxID=374 RepID=UPI0024B26331|nr:hypothetical protein [Bradyrhizobium barranii]WFT99029.1 hypothetical protein QA633_19300 [Bradyrhizobium barranii]
MPGLVPGIHVLRAVSLGVDGRDKPGHDAVEAVGAPNAAPTGGQIWFPLCRLLISLTKSHVQRPDRFAETM